MVFADGSREGNVMARKIVFFLMVGVFLGVLTGLAVADYWAEGRFDLPHRHRHAVRAGPEPEPPEDSSGGFFIKGPS